MYEYEGMMGSMPIFLHAQEWIIGYGWTEHLYAAQVDHNNLFWVCLVLAIIAAVNCTVSAVLVPKVSSIPLPNLFLRILVNFVNLALMLVSMCGNMFVILGISFGYAFAATTLDYVAGMVSDTDSNGGEQTGDATSAALLSSGASMV